jgi:hypothetical protein
MVLAAELTGSTSRWCNGLEVLPNAEILEPVVDEDNGESDRRPFLATKSKTARLHVVNRRGRRRTGRTFSPRNSPPFGVASMWPDVGPGDATAATIARAPIAAAPKKRRTRLQESSLNDMTAVRFAGLAECAIRIRFWFASCVWTIITASVDRADANTPIALAIESELGENGPVVFG